MKKLILTTAFACAVSMPTGIMPRLAHADDDTIAAAATKADFTTIRYQTFNSWTGTTSTFSVSKNGEYKLDDGLGSKYSGKLSAAQLAALEKAIAKADLKGNNGKSVGGMVPDDTSFQIRETEGGKTYKISGFVDSSKLGEVKSLVTSLQDAVNKAQPPAAHPIAPAADDKSQLPEEVDFSLRHQIKDHWRDVTIKADGTVTVVSYAGSTQVKEVKKTFTSKITPNEAAQLVAALKKSNFDKLPAEIPVAAHSFGDDRFAITTKDGGKSHATGGWVDEYSPKYQKITDLVHSLEGITARVPDHSTPPVNPDPTNAKDDFKGLELEIENPMALYKSHLSIDKDGNYVYDPPHGRPQMKGKLTAEELSAVKASFNGSGFDKLPASPGGMIPDGSSFKLTANGKTVSGFEAGYMSAGADAHAWAKLRPILDNLDAVEKAVDQGKPFVAPPKADPDAKGTFASILGPVNDWFKKLTGVNGENDAMNHATDAGRPSRTTGMADLLRARIDAASDKAKDGKESAGER